MNAHYYSLKLNAQTQLFPQVLWNHQKVLENSVFSAYLSRLLEWYVLKSRASDSFFGPRHPTGKFEFMYNLRVINDFLHLLKMKIYFKNTFFSMLSCRIHDFKFSDRFGNLGRNCLLLAHSELWVTAKKNNVAKKIRMWPQNSKNAHIFDFWNKIITWPCYMLLKNVLRKNNWNLKKNFGEIKKSFCA